MTGLTVWGVLVLGVAAVGGGTLTRVPLAVLTLTALAAFEAVTPLPAAAIALGGSVSSARRIAAILDAPEPVADPLVPLRLPDLVPGGPAQGGPAQGGPAHGVPAHVRLSGACVRYRADGPAALTGLDLDLAPGRRVAMVGPSGAGKSTAAAVLLRFCELSAGSATLNGQDLSAYAADDVRILIGGCAQDPHIFAASLTANLRVARPGATDAELADAARRARLLDWIESLPLGWETQAGLRGSALSGGQRQRLALARALLADPAVLVLDEPVAHLDGATRRTVTADLLSATRGRTTLLITHDLAGLEQVDEIVVLEGGAVIERGGHAQLLAAGGWYADRWHEQEEARSDASLRGSAGRTSPRPRTRCSRARSGRRRQPEVRDSGVERLTLAQVGRDRNAVTGPGVRAGQGRPADPRVSVRARHPQTVHVGAALPVLELPDVEVAGLPVQASGGHPAEEDVARGLHQPLAHHDPLAAVLVDALARIRLEHRRRAPPSPAGRARRPSPPS